MSQVHIDSTPDDVESQLGEDMRLSLLLAAQAAQRMAQMFDERAREAESASRERTQQFQAELHAHHSAALAVTRGAGSDQWWQDSTPRQLAAAWQAARVWEGRDPEMTERAEELRQGFADRYGITNPDELRLVDVMAMRGDSDDKSALLDSPLAEAQWQAEQARTFGSELRTEADRLRGELADLPVTYGVPQRQFVVGDEVHAFDRKDWLESRLGAVTGTADEADALLRTAEARVERLASTQAKPSQETPNSWAARWDTPERREALRGRLQAANVPPDAARARMLTDHAQGMPPGAAAWRPPTGAPVNRRPPNRLRPQEQRQQRRR